MFKLCCLIVPYFGKLPETFQVFLHTCAINAESGYHWLIFTDDRESCFECPDNVEIKYCSFEELKTKFQSKFSFPLKSLTKPVKLCDYKPAYGYIFDEELQNFRFWGYCDLDQFFGNLSSFISEDVLEKYDKLFTLGHLTIFRNEKRINELFMQEYRNPNAIIKNYVQVFSRESGQNLQFDEWPQNCVNINVFLNP